MRADPADPPRSASPLRVPLRCTRCQAVERHALERVVLAAPADRRSLGALAADWDGFYTHHLVACPRCGAVDAYRLEDEGRAWLIAHAHRGDPRVVLGFDARGLSMRPSRSLRELRGLALAHPGDGRILRRLGILQQQLGLPDEAVTSFRAAVRTDPREFEAAARLALGTLDADHPEQGLAGVEQALARLPGCHRDGDFAEVLTLAVAALERARPPRVLMIVWHELRLERAVQVSTVHLRRVARWTALRDGRLLSLRFAAEATCRPAGRLVPLLCAERAAVG